VCLYCCVQQTQILTLIVNVLSTFCPIILSKCKRLGLLFTVIVWIVCFWFSFIHISNYSRYRPAATCGVTSASGSLPCTNFIHLIFTQFRSKLQTCWVASSILHFLTSNFISDNISVYPIVKFYKLVHDSYIVQNVPSFKFCIDFCILPSSAGENLHSFLLFISSHK